MWVKSSAFSCAGVTSSCERRMLVPRPASICSFTAPQSLLSSPKRTSVPAPACPLNTAGPLCVPVNVTMRQGAACAVDAPSGAAAIKAKAATANSILVTKSLPLARWSRTPCHSRQPAKCGKAERRHLCRLSSLSSCRAAISARRCRSVHDLISAAADLDPELGAFGACHADAQDVAAGAVDRERAAPLVLGVELAHDVGARIAAAAALAIEQLELQHLRRVGAAGERDLRQQVAGLQVGREVVI